MEQEDRARYKTENDRKKRYLRRYRNHWRRVKRIEAELEEIRDMKISPSASNDGMPKGNTKNDLSKYAADLDERENKLYAEGVERVKVYKDISWRISQLPDEDERDVLFYRYIKGCEFWEISKAMNYSISWIYNLHGKALFHLTL